MPLELTINGQSRTFDSLEAQVSLNQVIAEMNLKSDRVAVEYNGIIAQRTNWGEIAVSPGDRLEIVHFVGGGRG
jgi:sulfur carrier protein